MKRLLIISHTPHQFRGTQIYGFSPTVREINYLATMFDKVIHVAPLHPNSSSSISISYSENVEFIPIPPVGGSRFWDKMKIIITAPLIIRKVFQQLREVDFFQFRGPTAIGVYLIPCLIFFSKRRGWFKYAGNWNDQNMPTSYRFQKFLLSHLTKRNVTINGRWPGLNSNFLFFENPCLLEGELNEGMEVAKLKNFSGKLTLLFVGRIDQKKGLDILVQILNNLKVYDDIGELILIGEGEITRYREHFTKKIAINFTGGLTRAEINKYYKKAHILILPSLSEGFPKVVAEAAAYGCVPAVSDVSSISQYITNSNGLLFKSFNAKEMTLQFEAFLSNRNELARKSSDVINLAINFTYSHYLDRIKNEIIGETVH